MFTPSEVPYFVDIGLQLLKFVGLKDVLLIVPSYLNVVGMMLMLTPPPQHMNTQFEVRISCGIPLHVITALAAPTFEK